MELKRNLFSHFDQSKLMIDEIAVHSTNAFEISDSI